MNVKGNHEFKISKEQLWTYLMDPDVLAKITPGVSKLEVTGDDSYNTISDIKIGPVKGSFKGKLKVEDKNEPASFVINMEQLSKIGNAHAKIAMNIGEAENGNAMLSFDGNAKLSGMIARTGQRVLSGVANAITKEVFAALEEHIEENGGATTNQNTEVATSNNEATSTPTPITTENKIIDEKVIERDNTTVTQNIIEEKILDTAPLKEAKEMVAQKVESTTTSSTNEKGGFLSPIINFFKSIFSNK